TISSKRSYPYRINRNVGLGYLKRLLPYLIIHPPQLIGKRLDRLLELILSATEPVRKKNRTRKKRIMRGTERHIYESNYRPTI
ncbi:MAG: hypothetical protein KDC34_18660, partial [Saprospiraceae bacterium]|nr:hypothetical protein [Saprospiraceae bacterium]